MSVGIKCIPKKLVISALNLFVFFKSIYLKSSCVKPCQLISQFLVNLKAQKQIGINTKSLISSVSIFILKKTTIGTGATDQNGSYKLELLSITLKI